MSLYIPLLSHEIRLTTACDLTCFYCPLWINKKTTQYIQEPLKNNNNLKQFLINKTKLKKDVHIYGGDPLKSDTLIALCKQLKALKKKIILWTHGQYPCEIFDQLVTYIDDFILYYPAANVTLFREFSGVEGFNNLNLLIDYLKERHKTVKLAHHIKPDNIQYLAEIYEGAYDQNVDLILTYNRLNHFSKDSLAFIKRFRRIPNVTLYKSAFRKDPDSCLMFPYGALSSNIQFVTILLYKLYNGLRVQLGL